MARMTDTAKGYRKLMGSAVEIAEVLPSSVVQTGAPVRGRVWSPAPLRFSFDPFVLRINFRMPLAQWREAVFVLAEGGRVFHAEIDVRTGKGYGVPLTAVHDTPDAEILDHAAEGAA